MEQSLQVDDDILLLRGERAGKDNVLSREDKVPVGFLERVEQRPRNHNGAHFLVVRPARDELTHGVVDDADALRDRLRGDRVITRHHHHLDASSLAITDSGRHSLARRVHEGHHAKEDQALQREVRAVRVILVALGELVERQEELGKGQDALSLGGHHSVQVLELRVELGCHGVVLASDLDVGATLEHLVGRALNEEQGTLVAVLLSVDGGHELGDRGEGHLGDLGVGLAVVHDGPNGLEELNQTALTGVSLGHALLDRDGLERDLVLLVVLGVDEHRPVAEGGALLQLLELGVLNIIESLAVVFRQRDIAGEHLVVVDQMRDRHAVLRERASLVRGNHSHRPKSLHRLRVLDEHVLLEHLISSQLQRNRQRQQQPLRHVGNNDTNHEHD
mmetsp:Transcript_28862/g.66686  ORF Transcript_28862/g.66686 Transcript_28862/m.66686 type:complete len:390 (-) Transcript_28862:1432-2601(-)